MKKIPEITLYFWIMKICATTLGETAGDLMSMTLNIGYGISSIILISLFIITLIIQLKSKSYYPLLFWTVILSTSTAGTTLSDYMDRTLELGYPLGMTILLFMLISILGLWYKTEKTIAVDNIHTPTAEIFYWSAILCSNTLGTATGDFLADSSGLGFFGGAALITGLILMIVGAYYKNLAPRLFLFWTAFVLTRPLGATMGDMLSKTPEQGGLGCGTIYTSLILLGLLILFIYMELRQRIKSKKSLMS